MAFLHDAQRMQQLTAKEIGAPSLVGERGKRTDDRIPPGDASVIGFDTPQRDHEARLHAEFRAHGIQQRAMFDHARLTLPDAFG